MPHLLQYLSSGNDFGKVKIMGICRSRLRQGHAVDHRAGIDCLDFEDMPARTETG